MPGRQSHGRTPLKQQNSSKGSKKSSKRNLDAFAIATKQNPERFKVRQHRLGEFEGDPSRKRKSYGGSHGSIDSTAGHAHHRQPKGRFDELDIDEGSDSEGNQWKLGEVDSNDDSELDSDEAMGESGDERFDGFAFRGSSSVGHSIAGGKHKASTGGKRSVLLDLAEPAAAKIDVDDESNEESELGEDAVDLEAMLDESDDGEPNHRVDRRRNPPQRSSSPSLQSRSDSEDEKGSTLSLSDDEEDTQNTAKLSALREFVGTLEAEPEHPSKRPRIGEVHESMKPSEFGLRSSKKLSITDLLPSVTDPNLKRSLKLLTAKTSSSKKEGIPGKLDVPLVKRQQDRLDRKAAFEKSKQTLSRWVDTVKHNRRSDHLSFPLADLDATSAKSSSRLVPTMAVQPQSGLERAIKSIMQESGMLEKDGHSDENEIRAHEELEVKELPLEAIQARRAELRMARELLFREEVRAKRIKKIKSKAYRRVHRKQRAHLEEKERAQLLAEGINLSEDEREANDRRRAEERMGARHRESKWAKGVKTSRRATWDDDARAGIVEMARRGDELKRRIEGKDELGHDADSLLESSDSESDDTDEQIDEDVKSSRLLRKLDELQDNDRQAASDHGSGSRLASMKFMQNADAARRRNNDNFIARIRNDLDGVGTSSDEEPQVHGRRLMGPDRASNSFTLPVKSEITSEFEERVDSDEEKNGNQESSPRSLQYDQSSLSQPSAKVRPTQSQSQILKATVQSDRNQPSRGSELRGQAKPSTTKLSSTPGQTMATAPKNSEIWPSVELHYGQDNDEGGRRSPDSSRSSTKNLLAIDAFAGDDVQVDFEREKKEMVEKDQEKIIDQTLPGWGNWTGSGLSKKTQQRNHGRFLTKQPGIAKENRKDAKLERVLISEKRVKRNGKYLAKALPHPFETRQQYERSMRLPIGPEWATKTTYQNATKPRILKKQGIIAPMSKPVY